MPCPLGVTNRHSSSGWAQAPRTSTSSHPAPAGSGGTGPLAGGSNHARQRDCAMADNSSSTIARVLADLQEHAAALSAAAHTLTHTNLNIKTEIEQTLVHLQFQDRISQMLCHVRDNIIAVSRELQQADPGQVNVGQHLTQLEQSYAMAEERQGHSGAPPARISSAAEAADITFF